MMPSRDRAGRGGAFTRAAKREEFVASLPHVLDILQRHGRQEIQPFMAFFVPFIERDATATAAAELVPAARRRGGDPRSREVQEIAERLRDYYLREMSPLSYRQAARDIHKEVVDYASTLYEANRNAGRFPTAPLHNIAHAGLLKGGLIRAGKITSADRIERFLSGRRYVFHSRNETQMADGDLPR